MQKITINDLKIKEQFKGHKRRSNYEEMNIQKELCRYVSLAYPKAIFNVDLSGSNLSKTQAGLAKVTRSDRGFPDFMLFQPMMNADKSKMYHGLFIEIKKDGQSLYHKSKTDQSGFPIHATPHIAEQAEMIRKLNEKGYYARFGIGLRHCIEIVDNYMKGKL